MGGGGGGIHPPVVEDQKQKTPGLNKGKGDHRSLFSGFIFAAA